MTDKTSIQTYDKINRHIDESDFFEVFKSLSVNISRQGNSKLIDLLKRQEDTYKYMIHYLVEGFSDSGREKILSDIKSTLRFINDSWLREIAATDSADAYSSTLRFGRLRRNTLKDLLSIYKSARAKSMLAAMAGGDRQLEKESDEALENLFLHVWTMFGASDDDYRTLDNVLSDPETPFSLKAQIISALLLGNLSYFDRNALQILINTFEADINPRISARTLIAIVLIEAAYPDRVNDDENLKTRLSLWEDSIVYYRQLREVVMSLIRARDTERISNKMKKEVLPELMKLRPEILNKLRDTSEISDIDTLEENPEWEELLSKSGLGEKLKELNEMQMDGGDVMMMAFSNLKSYPFFKSVPNWFLPFTSTHHDLDAQILQNSGILYEFLQMDGMMCDSDKYSFALSLEKMPEEQRKMMASRMGEQAEQLREAMAEKKLKSSIPEFDEEVTRFTRDIYRFFKLFPRKNEFVDPFLNPLDFTRLPFLSNLLTDSDILKIVGTFYFQRGYYAEALPLLMRLDTNASDGESIDTHLWEQIGYCHNALGELSEAMKWYRKAELLHPDSKWLVRQMAICSRLLKNFDEASDYYSKALESDPDNYSLLMNAGHCRLESDDPKSALSNYYHADYVRPDSPTTWRAIAWGEFANGDFDRSLQFYDRILASEESTATDHLNAGHASLAKGDMKKAISNYKNAARYTDFGIEKLAKSLDEDMESLQKAGVDRTTVRLMLDKVKYDLE